MIRVTNKGTDSILSDERDFSRRWRERRVELLQERLEQGERYVEVQIGELQQLLLELIGLHRRLDRLEWELMNYATRWSWPTQRIDIPSVLPEEIKPDKK